MKGILKRMKLGELEASFLSDRDIAKLVGFSSEWVRQQRHYRRHGKRHVLTIDPVLIGEKPRYRAEDVRSWIASLGGSHVV